MMALSYAILAVLFVLAVLLVLLVVRYRRLDEETKKVIQSALRRMGFFMVILLMLPGAVAQDTPPAKEPGVGYPVLLNGHGMAQAGAALGGAIINLCDQEDAAWLAGAMAFLATNSTNSTNLTF